MTDASQVGALLDQVRQPVATVVADDAYDQGSLYEGVAERHPEASVVVPPRSRAVLSNTAEREPTPRDRHLEMIAEHGRWAWRKRSGYNLRALAEAVSSRWKRVIGNGLCCHTDDRQAAEIAIAVRALNRMLDLERPNSVRVA